jgi:hypothetical protein
MISYTIAVLGILLATLMPVYLSLYLFSSLGRLLSRYAAMLGIGLTFWFFFDTMGDAAQLDVNEAINAFGGFTHFALVSVFLAGIVVLAIFDHYAVPKPEGSRVAQLNAGHVQLRSLFLIPAGVAAVMGIHGLGEGWDFGAAGSQAPTQSLTDAFGGVNPLISYPLHKFLEAGIIAILYFSFVGVGNAANRRKWDVPVLGILFGLPSVIGASIGYYASLDTTYFFAFGVSSALYAALRLSEPALESTVGGTAPHRLDAKMILAMTLGFFLLYTAALFH